MPITFAPKMGFWGSRFRLESSLFLRVLRQINLWFNTYDMIGE
jgi:hypothetical protein